MQWSHIALAETEGAAAESGGGVTRRPYVRKRYTDTRHPTKELPDVRQDEADEGALPTVQSPPVSRQQQQ